MFVSPKHSQFQKKCANRNTSAPARWSQFNFCRSLALWPRVKQRKWILTKKNKKNRITKKTNRQEESPEETKKTRKNKKTQKSKKTKKPAFSAVFFVFLVFFLGFGFLVCFFWLLCFFCFFIFFRQTLYSLCCWTHNSCNARSPQYDLKIIGSSDSLEVI